MFALPFCSWALLHPALLPETKLWCYSCAMFPAILESYLDTTHWDYLLTAENSLTTVSLYQAKQDKALIRQLKRGEKWSSALPCVDCVVSISYTTFYFHSNSTDRSWRCGAFVRRCLYILSCVPSLPQLVLPETFIDSDNSILICPRSYFSLIKQGCLILFLSLYSLVFPQTLFSRAGKHIPTIFVRKTWKDTDAFQCRPMKP